MQELQNALSQKNLDQYLEHFSLPLQESEKTFILKKFSDFSLEKLAFSVKQIKISGKNAEFFVQVVFSNDHSVLFETWELHLTKKTGDWMIERKAISSNPKTMFRIKIPTERTERVKSIEIKHEDIILRFEDALIFYDNLPEIETALLILGKGHVRFSPSHSREKHILQTLLKTPHVKDEIEYAFLRFSQSFFNRNISIDHYPDPAPTIDINKEKILVYSLFTKHYTRLFTVENSITGELLSILPVGDQAMIEFKGKKTGIHSYIYSPRGEDKISLYEWENERIICLYTPQNENKEKQMFFQAPDEYDIDHYQSEVDFDPETFYLAAKTKIKLRSRIQNLRSARFRFNSDLTILRISDSANRELFFTQDKFRNSLYIHFYHSLNLEEEREIEIFYRGKIQPAKNVGEIYFSRKYGDEIITTPFDPETTFIGPSLYWYPKSPFDDYFTSEVKIIVPPDYIAISNGNPSEVVKMNGIDEVERLDDIGDHIHTFISEKPIKALAFLVGPLKMITEAENPIPIQVFKEKDFPSSQEVLVQEVGSIISFFNEKFGIFPFDHLSLAQRSWTTKGGLSAASFLILQDLPRAFRSLNGKTKALNNAVDLSRWQGYFLAHEIAHQWWGHGVTWKTYRDLWISEGLSQYAAILYLSEKYGQAAAEEIRQKFSQQTKKSSKWGPITLGSRLSHYDFEAFQMIVYNKTSLVFNMLRTLMGDESFFNGLRAFFSRFKYQSARTKDFIKTMEAFSDSDINLFFDTWFDGYELPQIEITKSIHEEKGRFFLKINVVQTRGLFIFPLLIEWREEGVVQQKRVVIDKRTQEFLIQSQVRQKKIRFNSDNAVPGTIKH